jgi:hypothetical protein
MKVIWVLDGDVVVGIVGAGLDTNARVPNIDGQNLSMKLASKVNIILTLLAVK